MPDFASMQTDGVRCPYWMPSRDARCGSTDLIDGRWCKRHTAAIQRQIAREHEKTKTQKQGRDQRDRERLVPRLPEMRALLARLEAEYERRTGSLTTDMAAYGGKGCTTTIRDNRRRLSDFNIARVNELARQISGLRDRIARAEALEGD